MLIFKEGGNLLKIKTTRFSELEVNKNDIINFSDGLLGFEGLKDFFLVDPGDHTLILWLQSVHESATAFPIIEPRIFLPDYFVQILPSDLEDLDLKDYKKDAVIYTILTIPPHEITAMSANLKAPIVINNKTKSARQIILQDNKLRIHHKMYEELKKCLANYSLNDSMRTKILVSEDQSKNAETPNDQLLSLHH